MIAIIMALVLGAQDAVGTPDDRTVAAALEAIKAQRPQQAIDTVAPLVARMNKIVSKQDRRVYCAMSLPEEIYYLASARVPAMTIAHAYCDALYLKGYALIDLDRVAEARGIFERLVAMAPKHPIFLTELGQSYRLDRNWPTMLDVCRQAAAIAEEMLGDQKPREQARAWRCQGYALVELNRLDEAEKAYRDCLKVDPADAIAQRELAYIRSHRR